MKKRRTLSVLGLLAVIFWFLGPSPNRPDYENASFQTNLSFDGSLSRIQDWNDSLPFKQGCEPYLYLKDSAKTPYCILYLHGFSATPEEGAPTHTQMADTFGFNLFAPTLFDHGLVTDNPLLHYTATGAWHTALQALSIAHGLGDSILIVCTSTGAPLGLRLANLDPTVAGLVFYSPNVTPADPNARLLNGHWGETIARLVLGSRMRDVGVKDEYYQMYWDKFYRIESLPEMQELCESAFEDDAVTATRTPVFIAAWYESDSSQDNVVSVEHMRWLAENLGSKRVVFETFPAGSHVIANGKYSLSQEEVLSRSIHFIRSLGILSRNVADTTLLR